MPNVPAIVWWILGLWLGLCLLLSAAVGRWFRWMREQDENDLSNQEQGVYSGRKEENRNDRSQDNS